MNNFDTGRTARMNDDAPRQDGDFVLYWMEHAQRAENNPALERAASHANELGRPLVVLFTVDPNYPDGNARHFTFMLEGLQETITAIQKRGAHFSLRTGSPPDTAAEMAQRAAVVVTDRGYLRHLRQWRQQVAHECGCLMEQVDADVIVPVALASDKQETAARTFRPKVHRMVGDFTELPRAVKLKNPAKDIAFRADKDLTDVAAFVEDLGCDASVGPVDWIAGGTRQARLRLKAFLSDDLDQYGDGRSDITDRHVSIMSPYLHLGQISPLELYLAVNNASAREDSRSAYIEELLVRRELAKNFVHYNTKYDQYDALPGWARDTLSQHRSDERENIYTKSQLENSKTDDPYWNAAMREMRLTGYLHNYMRMYWGKRVLGWMKDPKVAHKTLLDLNNKYFLDGRDANSFTNVAWIFGLHDRGWPEREVYGKVRVMKPSGLKRKFDVDAYVRWANSL